MTANQSKHTAFTPAAPAMIDINAWRRRIREDTFSHYHIAMGVALRRNGESAAAIEQFRAAIATTPGHALAYWNWTGLLRDAGRADEADAVHREASAANPSYQLEALHLDGQRLVEEREYLAAAERFREAMRGGWKPDIAMRDLSDALRWQGVMIAGQGREMEALPFLEEASQLNATDETLVSLSDTLLQLGRNAQAVAALRSALVRNPLLAASHHALAQHLNRLNDRADILSVAHAIAADPMFSAAYGMFSQFALRDGRLQDAVNSAARNVRLHGLKPMMNFHLGVALLASGRYEEARSVNARLREMAPQERYPIEQQAMILIAQGDDLQALPLLASLLATAPNDPMALGCKGHALFRAGRLEEAEAILRSAMVGNPDVAWARLSLAWMLRRTNRAEEAVAHFRRAVELSGRWVLYEARLCPWVAEEALAAYHELGVV